MDHEQMKYYLNGLKLAYTLKYITGNQYCQELTRLKQDTKNRIARLEKAIVYLEGESDQMATM